MTKRLVPAAVLLSLFAVACEKGPGSVEEIAVVDVNTRKAVAATVSEGDGDTVRKWKLDFELEQLAAPQGSEEGPPSNAYTAVLSTSLCGAPDFPGGSEWDGQNCPEENNAVGRTSLGERRWRYQFAEGGISATENLAAGARLSGTWTFDFLYANTITKTARFQNGADLVLVDFAVVQNGAVVDPQPIGNDPDLTAVFVEPSEPITVRARVENDSWSEVTTPFEVQVARQNGGVDERVTVAGLAAGDSATAEIGPFALPTEGTFHNLIVNVLPGAGAPANEVDFDTADNAGEVSVSTAPAP